jgi:transcriptional regulator with XRE-family HTH domain
MGREGGAVAEETFGARLKRLRERAGLSQGHLAERAGVNRYSVIKWERDEHEPMWSSVLALARALGCRVADFEGTAEPPAGVRPARKGRPRKAPAAPEAGGQGEAAQGSPEVDKLARKGGGSGASDAERRRAHPR